MNKLLILMMLVGVVSCAETVDREMWRIAEEACSANDGIHHMLVHGVAMRVRCINKAEFEFRRVEKQWRTI